MIQFKMHSLFWACRPFMEKAHVSVRGPWLLTLLSPPWQVDYFPSWGWASFVPFLDLVKVVLQGSCRGSFPPICLLPSVPPIIWGAHSREKGSAPLITRNWPDPTLPRRSLCGSNQRAAADGEVSESLRSSGLGLAEAMT